MELDTQQIRSWKTLLGAMLKSAERENDQSFLQSEYGNWIKACHGFLSGLLDNNASNMRITHTLYL